MCQSVLQWTDFFPDTPAGLGVPFPVSSLARVLPDFCTVSTCCALVRLNSRAYASFVLAIKIKARADLLARQRIALQRILDRIASARLLADFLAQETLLEGWTVVVPRIVPRTIPPPPQAVHWVDTEPDEAQPTQYTQGGTLA